jgi:hypothetical protein
LNIEYMQPDCSVCSNNSKKSSKSSKIFIVSIVHTRWNYYDNTTQGQTNSTQNRTLEQ